MNPSKSERDEILEVVRSWIREAERVAVLTGAGISTESGIPDFRGPQGNPTALPDAEHVALYDRIKALFDAHNQSPDDAPPRRSHGSTRRRQRSTCSPPMVPCRYRWRGKPP